MEVSQVAYRDVVQLNRKWLVEHGQEIGIVIDPILERSVGQQLLHETRVDVRTAVGGTARVAGLSVVPSAVALALDGETLSSGVRDSGNNAGRPNVINVLAADVVLLVRECGPNRRQ